jgi:YVTN family beta-propeller protein
MKKIICYLALFYTSIYFTSCGSDDIIIPPAVNTSDGAYILSEGGFSPGTSKLSFYNNYSTEFTASIFNPGTLGITPDGMIKDGNDLYITEQGSGATGKIYKTDTNGTVISSNDAGASPYSLTSANGKLYVTNGPSNSVSVIDKNSLATINTVTVGIYPQEILAIGNYVFVCNTSLFGGGTDSTVSVIDANTDAVVYTIPVGKTPSALARTTDNKLLIGCPGDVSRAIIYKVDPVTFNKIDSFSNLTNGFCKDIAIFSRYEIYFISGDVYAEGNVDVYNFISRTSFTFVPRQANELNFGLACDRKNFVIYVGVAASNFTSSGKFRVYGVGGDLLNENSITTGTSIGIAPRRIVVKN